ncbi:MAG: hypothetical protein R3F46_03075 [bacterium]
MIVRNMNTGITGLIAGSIVMLAASCSGSSGLENTPAPADLETVIGEAITMEQPQSLEKTGSGWQDWGTAGDMIDWYSVWLGLHQSVGYGNNKLDETKWVAKSSGVYSFEQGEQDYINFPASGTGSSYVQFGLKDIPFGMVIREISFETDFNSSENPSAGYYVGYSNYESGAYQWYGPFYEGHVEVHNLFTDNVNDQQRGYFIIAVSGNSYFTDVSDVEVEIGNPVEIAVPELREAIPNEWVIDEHGRVDWDLLYRRPEIEPFVLALQLIL